MAEPGDPAKRRADLPLFLIAFIGVPLAEIYLLIEVGQVIGALPTIGLCVLTAVVGGGLLRHQGLNTLQRARDNLDQNKVPALELLEGAALVVGGALLMTPGFATDALGFACLLPPTRRAMVRALLSRAHVSYGPADRGSGPRGGADGHSTIEGEYRRRE